MNALEQGDMIDYLRAKGKEIGRQAREEENPLAKAVISAYGMLSNKQDAGAWVLLEQAVLEYRAAHDIADGWYRVEVPFAVFLFEVENGMVVRAAPICKCVGKAAPLVFAYWRTHHGATITRMNDDE